MSNENKLKLFLLFTMFLMVITFVVIKPKSIINPTEEHKRLCLAYALKDHRLEIGIDRFEHLAKFGDPNDTLFFYESCLAHVTGKPTQRKYMEGVVEKGLFINDGEK